MLQRAICPGRAIAHRRLAVLRCWGIFFGSQRPVIHGEGSDGSAGGNVNETPGTGCFKSPLSPILPGFGMSERRAAVLVRFVHTTRCPK